MVVVVATPTIIAATLGATTPTSLVHAVATIAASLFPLVAFRQLFLRVRPEDRVGRLVAGQPQGLNEGKSRNCSRQ